MLGEGAVIDKELKLKIYSDAWGVRKLVTHVLRNLRTERVPREPCMNLSSAWLMVSIFEQNPTIPGHWGQSTTRYRP